MNTSGYYSEYRNLCKVGQERRYDSGWPMLLLLDSLGGKWKLTVGSKFLTYRSR